MIRRSVAGRGSSAISASKDCYVGLDFGTSGARASVIDVGCTEIHVSKAKYMKDKQTPWHSAWERALEELIQTIPDEMVANVKGVAFDGTSATTLLLDRSTGKILADPKLYNESQSTEAVEKAKGIAPPGHPAQASTSTLSKVIAWDMLSAWQECEKNGVKHPGILHQADWLASLLHGDRFCSDYTNSLKLGYDPEKMEYPHWLASQDYAHLFPTRLVAPGDPVGCVTAGAEERFGLPQTCMVSGGVTDSIAAFIAAGVSKEGEAVTSLGSTLAIKMLSKKRVDAVEYGIYSHRLGDVWLVGGASNSGGVVLRKFFSDEKLEELTPLIKPEVPTGLNYYPLSAPGERFPVNDPNLQPRLEPRPESDVQFLQGMFEGIADIERKGFQLLADLGAGSLKRVVTAGGGAVNSKWTEIRSKKLGVPVEAAENGEAAYGAALLAKQGAPQ
ncbi:hypothetical protein BSKO_11526 [Bryopsis sp. KO-2023]|nr:hypothetical protein BSKO_11526 [Bryopsis sp. KO-2023]